MAYGDNTLGADHQWTFNNTLGDEIGGLTLSNSSGNFVTNPITRDSTHSYRTDGRLQQAFVSPNSTSGSANKERYAFGGWFMVDQLQGPPTFIHKQGGVNSFAIFLWAGNNVMVQALENDGITTLLQLFSNISLTSNRPYHFFVRFSGSNFDDEFSFYLDGTKQGSTASGEVSIESYTADLTWGDGDQVNTGTEDVDISAPIEGFWSQWWIWNGASASISETDIKNEIFAAGAIPDNTISTGTQSAMQSQLDSFSNSTTDDSPLNFLIEPVTGDGDLELIADNITFNDRASIHIRYEGNGILTWVNRNGSNASIGSTINQNIVFVEEVDVEITALDINTSNPIVGARVYLTDSGNNVIINELTDSSGKATAKYRYLSDENVSGVIRKGSSPPYYIEGKINSVITNTGLSSTVLMRLDQ